MGSKAILTLIFALSIILGAVDSYDEPYKFIETSDGAKLALYRISEGSLGPVVLVHGLGVNRYNFLLGPDGGLANYLADKGFEVFAVDMRGVGNSTKGKRNDFKSIALDDFPLILDAVESLTGKNPQAVGHSLGGMIIGTYLASTKSPKLRAAVIVSSPTRFREGSLFYELLTKFPKASVNFSQVPYEGVLRVFSPIFGGTNPYAGLGYAKGTINDATLRAVARKAIERPPKELMGDVVSFVSRDCMCDSNKSSYIENIKYARTPLLILAGANDVIATPEAVRVWFELSGSEDKDFVEVSRANGFSVDAGHGDILLGDYAAKEVYPIIARWLSQR